MEGHEEGVYGWVALNDHFGTFDKTFWNPFPLNTFTPSRKHLPESPRSGWFSAFFAPVIDEPLEEPPAKDKLRVLGKNSFTEFFNSF